MPLSEVQFQPTAHKRIQQALHSGRVPHAYLFAGRPGVGREMMAARLGQLLLCSSPREVTPPSDAPGNLAKWRDACGQCEDCRLFQTGGHPDFHRIYRTLNKHHPDKLVQKRKALELSVDVIRHFLLDCVSLSPSRQRAKVFVVSEAERLSPGAQNAMLKTLEEPPGHSYVILVATSADELLPTTRSRCHLVQFGGLPGEFIRQALIGRSRIDPAAANFLAELVQGSLGQALQYARADLFSIVPELIDSLMDATENPLAASKVWQDLSKAIAQNADGKKSAASDEEIEDDASVQDADDETEVESAGGPETRTLREAQLTLLAMLATLLRDVQRVSVGHAPAALPQERRLAELSRRSSPRQIGAAVRAIGTAEYQLDLNAGPGLVFDSLAIAIHQALSRPLTANAR